MIDCMHIKGAPAEAQCSKRDGGVIVAGGMTFDYFESCFRELLPSVERYKMRPLSNDLVVSFGAQSDYFSAIRSASGVNIAIETGWVFDKQDNEKDAVSHCYLRFQLAERCLDDRLKIFLDDLSMGKDCEQKRGQSKFPIDP